MLTMTQKTKADTVVKKKKGPIMEKLVLLITAVVVLGQGTTQARATDHETYTPQQIKEMPRMFRLLFPNFHHLQPLRKEPHHESSRS